MKEEMVKVFTTKDGKRFDDESEAVAHERRCEITKDVNEYLSSVENSRTRTRLYNVIIEWEAYKSQLELEV